MEDNKDKANFNLLEQSTNNHHNHKTEVKAYKRRWLILAIFMFYAAINSYQWIEYSIVTNIIMRYYNVSSVTVDWTSIIYMALYAPLVIPASYIVDKKGLRVAALIGALGTALGTGIKVFSIGRDLFWIVLIGQAMLSASQLVILCLPPKIATVWFKPNEVSTACSLGVFGTQFGCAIGYALTPLIVKNHEDPERIGPDLYILCWGLTACIVPGALAVILYFPLQPPKPPSLAQAGERRAPEKFTLRHFVASLGSLATNRGFLIHNLAFGINIGVFSAVGTLLNQLVLFYFPGEQEMVGMMGLVMIVIGMFGSVLFGIILDKTHKYKEMTVTIYFLTGISVVLFMFALKLRSTILSYVSIGILGLFTNAYFPVGFELAMELTYPSSESTTSGLLTAPSQILGVFFALYLGKLNSWLGPFWALATQALLILCGAIITCFVPNDLRRQKAFNQSRAEAEMKILNNKFVIN